MLPKATIILILSIVIFSACQNQQSAGQPAAQQTDSPHTSHTTPIPVDTAKHAAESAQQASESTSTQLDTDLGPEISKILIRSKATKDELENSENGIMPWFTIDSAKQKIANLIDPNEKVLAFQKVKLIIDYPLARPVTFDLTSPTKEFTRKQLVLAISKKYHEIYAEEENTAKTKTIPQKDRKTLANRNDTDGKYGIWGHDLSDLDLDDIIVHQKSDGTILLELEIES